MKPAIFDYHAPTSVDDALALLKSHAATHDFLREVKVCFR